MIQLYAEGYKTFDTIGHLRGIALCTKGLMQMWRIYQQDIKGKTMNFDSDSEGEEGFIEDECFFDDSDEDEEEDDGKELKEHEI